MFARLVVLTAMLSFPLAIMTMLFPCIRFRMGLPRLKSLACSGQPNKTFLFRR